MMYGFYTWNGCIYAVAVFPQTWNEIWENVYSYVVYPSGIYDPDVKYVAVLGYN